VQRGCIDTKRAIAVPPAPAQGRRRSQAGSPPPPPLGAWTCDGHRLAAVRSDECQALAGAQFKGAADGGGGVGWGGEEGEIGWQRGGAGGAPQAGSRGGRELLPARVVVGGGGGGGGHQGRKAAAGRGPQQGHCRQGPPKRGDRRAPCARRRAQARSPPGAPSPHPPQAQWAPMAHVERCERSSPACGQPWRRGRRGGWPAGRRRPAPTAQERRGGAWCGDSRGAA
jgi:hypothetical protein